MTHAKIHDDVFISTGSFRSQETHSGGSFRSFLNLFPRSFQSTGALKASQEMTGGTRQLLPFLDASA